MRLEPSEVSALLSQGAAFEALGHDEDARAAYARALELIPGLPPARRGLARLDVSSRGSDSR
jgi:Flp pilus assembly protein TadD